MYSLVDSYLTRPREYIISAGVPPGSVLPPVWWIDVVNVSVGSEIVDYADDIVVFDVAEYLANVALDLPELITVCIRGRQYKGSARKRMLVSAWGTIASL